MIHIAGMIAVVLQSHPTAATPEYWTPGSKSLMVMSDPADATSDGAGRIYVADRARAQILVLRDDLSLVGVVGLLGSGHGAFRELRSVVAIDRQQFAALDKALRRISVFRWDGARPRLTRVIHVPFEPYDLCPAQHGSFVVYGEHDGHRLP